MGNKQQGTKEKIIYTTTKGLTMEINLADLQGASRFPKLPKKQEILQQFEIWKQNVLLQEDDKQLLQTIESKYKFRICHVHQQNLQLLVEKQQKIEKENKTILEVLDKHIKKLINNCNDVDMMSIKQILQDPRNISEKVRIVKNTNLINFFSLRLLELEEVSRVSNNFRDQIKIIEIFATILKHDGINHNQLFHERKLFKALIFNIHPIEPQITGMILKMIAGQRSLIWIDGNLNQILDVFQEFQESYRLSSKFELMIRMIYFTKNLVMVYIIVKFLFRFLYSIDEKLQKELTNELFSIKFQEKELEEIFKQVKIRIKFNIYKKEDSTYDSVRKALNNFEHPLAGNGSNSFRLTKQFQSIIDNPKSDSLAYIENLSDQTPINNQSFLEDNYFYYESGQEDVYKAIELNVIEWIDALQNMQLVSSAMQSNAANEFEFQDDNNSTFLALNDDYISKQSFYTQSDTQEVEGLSSRGRISYNEEEVNNSKLKIQQEEEIKSLKIKIENEMATKIELQRQFQESQNTIFDLKETIIKLQNENFILKKEKESLSTQKITEKQLNGSSDLGKQSSNPPPPPLQHVKSINQTTSIPTPPPPPPPPPNLSKLNSPPAPPPPPFGKGVANQQPKNEQQLNRKPEIIPSVAMKQLFWNVIPDSKAIGSIFEKIQNEDCTLDLQYLEGQFQKVQEQRQPQSIQQSENKVERRIRLLPPERSQNIELVLGKLKITNQKIVYSILSIDKTVLTEQIVNSLASIFPSSEEVDLIGQFQGDFNLFALPEQFIYSIKTVNGFQTRIKALQIEYNYNENYQDLKIKIGKLSQAFEKIHHSKELEQLILITLRLGNFLNAKTSKGNAASFKLDAIEKCSDVKSNDNQSNLLNYIIETSEKVLKGEVVSQSVINELEIVEKVSIAQLNSNYSELKKGLNIIQQAIESKTNDPEDRVDFYFSTFHQRLQFDLNQLQQEITQLEGIYKQCCSFFGENPADQSDKFGERMMKLYRCLLKNKIAKSERLEKLKKVQDQKLRQLQSQNKTLIQRSDKQKQTWATPIKDNEQRLVQQIKNGRESMVEKEIKELQQFKRKQFNK